MEQTDLKLIESKQAPLTFIASEPLQAEAVVPADPQAREQIRLVLMRHLAHQIVKVKLAQLKGCQ